jgi:nickel-type superoxide dismutase maturation protease
MVREHLHPTHNAAADHWAPAGVLAWIVVGAATVALARRLGRRMVVAGDSMRPAFEAGDRLWIGPAVRLRPGQVVAVADPRQPGRLLVKRVHRIDDDRVEVRGDNDPASTDSRHFGPVPRASVAGRVVYRYAPARRAGWRPGRIPPSGQT